MIRNAESDVPRRFAISSADGKIQLVSYREKLLVNVPDENEAMRAFKASKYAGGDGRGSDAEVEAFFEARLAAWHFASPLDYIEIVAADPGAVSFADTLREFAKLKLEIRDYNRAMFLSFGANRVAVVVASNADSLIATEQSFRLPVLLCGRGLLAGPFLHSEAPCYTCALTGLERQGANIQLAQALSIAQQRLLAARLLESLFTRPFVPYVDDVLEIRFALDDAPNVYQALRVPRCETCDHNFRRFPARYNKHELRRVRDVLTRRGFLGG